jgi:CelD/BcsL family acetyltransferase involved in cellulose biosynthesis
MEFKIITNFEELDLLAGPWNALLEECASHVPFLRLEYLRTWWQAMGGGEWKPADLLIVVATEEEELVGIAPLFFSHNRESEPALLLVGSIEVSDYLDVIARPQDLTAFVAGLFDFLQSPALPPWTVLDWYNLLENSQTLPALESAAARLGWRYGCERLQHSPHILLPGDWETYLAGIDKKQRHEIRRKMRRLEESGLPVRAYVVEDPVTLEAEAEAFLALMAQDPEKAAFLTPLMRAFMHEVIRCAFDAHCLQLAFLEISGEKAAAYLNFDYLNRIWVYNSGLDRKFNEYSPGWVLLGYLLKWANERHAVDFDFMRGDEDYKYRFGAVDRFVVRATVRR